MRGELSADYDPLAEDDCLTSLLDVIFIFLIALMVVLTYFTQQEYDNRFAIPHGPAPALVAVPEADYSRMVVVSFDSDKYLAVNGQQVAEDQLVTRVAAALAERSEDADRHVVFYSYPTIPYGDVERIHLLLLGHGFTVLKEYKETQDETERNPV